MRLPSSWQTEQERRIWPSIYIATVLIMGPALLCSSGTSARAGTDVTYLCQAPTTTPTDEAAAGLSQAQLTVLLKESGVSASNPRVVGTGPSVTVLADEPTKSSDRNLKIEAIFLAKTLIEGAPGQIDKVQVIYSKKGEDGRFISIKKKEIQEYGQGRITAEAFLGSLHFAYVEPDDLPQVEVGPLKERRLLILERIEKLRKAGTGVKPFENIFQGIESAIKAGETTDLAKRLDDLEFRLGEQEEQMALAKKTASGHGLTIVRNKSWSSSANAMQPGNQAGAGTRTNANGGSFKALEGEFATHAAQEINKLAERNPTEAARLRELKRQIDEKFAANRGGEAVALIEQFKQIAWSKPVNKEFNGIGKGQFLKNHNGQWHQQGPIWNALEKRRMGN